MNTQSRTIIPLYVGIKDAVTMFGLSRDTFYRAVNKGEITLHKRGSRSLLQVSEISDWIEGRLPSQSDNGGRLVGSSNSKK
jgi:excisionase family DNA binding protein